MRRGPRILLKRVHAFPLSTSGLLLSNIRGNPASLLRKEKKIKGKRLPTPSGSVHALFLDFSFFARCCHIISFPNISNDFLFKCKLMEQRVCRTDIEKVGDGEGIFDKPFVAHGRVTIPAYSPGRDFFFPLHSSFSLSLFLSFFLFF